MPVYEFECDCGKRFEEFWPMDSRPAALHCICGGAARRVMSAPLVLGDTPTWATKHGKCVDRRGVSAVAEMIQDPDEVASGKEKRIETRSDLIKYNRARGIEDY